MEVDPAPRFAIVFATSRPVGEPRYDLEPARALLGYEPRDRWAAGLEATAGEGPAEGDEA